MTTHTIDLNKSRFKAIIWDMDGVLVDSEPVHFATWRVVFEKYGLPYNEAAMRRTFGMTSPEVIRRIGGENLEPDLAARIIEEKEILFRSEIASQADYLPGAREWLEIFQVSGLKQALASSGSPENIAVILDALDVVNVFDVIVSGKMMPSKPHPHIFLEAAENLETVPVECLVIEDAIAGVRAAKAAGMTCLAVATTNHAPDLKEADLVIGNLSELTPEHIYALSD